VAYSITNTDGSVNINISDQAIDSTFSLNLIGPGASNYGDDIARNTIRQLENFAGTTEPNPTQKLIGQLWYDKNTNILRVWSGTVWQKSRAEVVNTAPSGTGNDAPSSGDTYYNTVNNQAYIHDGTEWKIQNYAGEYSSAYKNIDAIGEPQTIYGTKFKTIYLKDAGDVPIAIAALVKANDSASNIYKGATEGETVMAVFSDSAFTVGNFASDTEGKAINYYPEFAGVGGVGLNIVKGMNLRTDYSQTSVPLADLATVASSANALYSSTTGTLIETDFSGGIGSTYIFNSKLDIIPADDNNTKLGDNSKVFAQTFTNELHLGKDGATSGKILLENANVDIGADKDGDTSVNGFPANHIYTKHLTVSGDTSFESGIQNFGTALSPVENLFAGNTTLTGTLTFNSLVYPASDGNNEEFLQTNGTGTLSWAPAVPPTRRIDSGLGLTGGGNLTADRTFNVGAGNYILALTDTIAVDAVDDTNTYGKVVARNNSSGGFTSGPIIAPTFTGNVSATTVTATTITATGTVQAEHLSSTDDATITDKLTAGTLTDGTLSINSGAITSGVSAVFSGNVTGQYFNGQATSAQYADLAEIYKADDEYEAGTVVKLGGEFEITQTISPEDVGVFGVISTDPAYLMNSDAEGLPVALTGRVPVKVVGPVEKGDRITSSGTAGHGKSYDEENYDPRVVIGRSLTDKETDDEGIIEVIIGIK
tara:strand:- start:7736 stop:9859 length:2124 start_codon:yes stop_codon:yes gene_type:complete